MHCGLAFPTAVHRKGGKMSWERRQCKKKTERKKMPPRRRKLTRSDYEELISLKGGWGKRRWGKRSIKGGGKMTNHLPEAMMLAHMMSKTNKNVKQ